MEVHPRGFWNSYHTRYEFFGDNILSQRLWSHIHCEFGFRREHFVTAVVVTHCEFGVAKVDLGPVLLL